MRLVFTLLTVGLGLGAGYFGYFARGSYAAYSPAQLETLEQNFANMREMSEDQAFSRQLLRDERNRRLLFYGLGGAAVFAALGAYLSKPARESFGRMTKGEEARFSAAMGSPEVAIEGARNKAAQLLGVNVNAPREVIEAALAAQLASRDAARMEGLAPDLREVARRQRDDLVRARDTLLKST